MQTNHHHTPAATIARLVNAWCPPAKEKTMATTYPLDERLRGSGQVAVATLQKCLHKGTKDHGRWIAHIIRDWDTATGESVDVDFGVSQYVDTGNPDWLTRYAPAMKARRDAFIQGLIDDIYARQGVKQ